MYYSRFVMPALVFTSRNPGQWAMLSHRTSPDTGTALGCFHFFRFCFSFNRRSWWSVSSDLSTTEAPVTLLCSTLSVYWKKPYMICDDLAITKFLKSHFTAFLVLCWRILLYFVLAGIYLFVDRMPSFEFRKNAVVSGI